MKVILAIDQSTAATKGLVFSLNGRLLARADVPHAQHTTPEGWVEHDPVEIFENLLLAARRALQTAGVEPEQVAVVGLSNQRETAVCWDKQSGQPLYNAIVWQCGRAVDVTAQVEAQGLASQVKDRTGLNLSPFFSAAKWGWMLRHLPAVQAAAQSRRLCCGTIDAWLLYKLTGQFKTDYSNASRTQLLNLDTLQWDETLCEAFGVPLYSLPQVCMSDANFGSTTLGGLLPRAVPIHGVLGDSHAALLGNRCTQPGMAKATYGTGSSIMLHAGAARPRRGHGIVTSLAWGRKGRVEYVLEGNINYAGAVTKWLVDDIGLLQNASEAGELAATVASTGGVYLVPAFSGLGAPHFNNQTRAALVGMNRGTQKAHLARAAEECIAFQIADVVECINEAAAQPLQALHVDGGPTRDAFLMQFQADVLGVPLKISSTEELSGAGAAFCAALGAGIATEEELFSNIQYRPVAPQMELRQRMEHRARWHAALNGVAALDLEAAT